MNAFPVILRRIALGCCLATIGPVSAHAHAILVDSTPAPDSDVRSDPVVIRLRFNSRIDGARSGVTARSLAPGTPDVPIVLTAPSPATLTGTVALTPGSWELRWQVLAIDGHITRGLIHFVVTPP